MNWLDRLRKRAPAAQAASPPAEPATIEAARARLAEGRLEDARRICQAIVAREADATALHWLGYIAQQQGEHEAGADYCRQAIAAGGDSWDLYLSLGLNLKALGLVPEAYEALLAAARRNPAWPEIAPLVLECAAAIGGPDRALALYGELFAGLNQPAVDRGAFALLGYVAQQIGEYETAVGYCRRAIAAGGRSGHLQFTLGFCLDALGRSGEAYEPLLASATLDPAGPDTPPLLLESATAVGGLDLARAHYETLFAPLASPAAERAWRGVQFRHGVDPSPGEAGLEVCVQARAVDWAAARGHPVLAAGEVEAIPIQTPPLGGAPAGPVITIPSNRPYVAELADVRVFAKSHMVLTPDGFALNEAGAHPHYGTFVLHDADGAVVAQRPDALLLDIGAFRIRELDAGVMLNGAGSEAFGHWTTEFLPRLQFLEQHPDFASLPIIVDDGMPQSHLDQLALIASNRLVVLRPGEGLRVRRLLYAPQPTFFPLHVRPNPIPPYAICPCSPRAYRYLKARVEARLGVQPPNGGKYYLSRRGRGWGRVSNEEEIRAFLEARGYRTVFMEALSFEEQVRVFQDAESIVAPVGSTLQNLVFAPVEAQIVVLTPPNVRNIAALYGQIRALGYAPQIVWGAGLGPLSQKHVDYRVPRDELAAALDGGRPPS